MYECGAHGFHNDQQKRTGNDGVVLPDDISKQVFLQMLADIARQIVPDRFCVTMFKRTIVFDEVFQQLQNNMFVRVGRSLIVNKRYIYVINLTEQQLILSGGDLKEPIVFYGQPKTDSPQNITLAREGLKQLKELLENEKGVDNG